MRKLLLIDGNAILHRGYHALPPLNNSKGEVVNGVYGFFSMLLNVVRDQKPEYLAVCFDRGKPTFRQAMYAGYHANRPKATEDFIFQIGLVHEILERIGIEVFELDGYEADDVIGTIAKRSVQSSKFKVQSLEVVILTGDRDLLQLVNGHVKILMPLVGITKTVLMDERSVEEKYGVRVEQFIDYKALIGDQSDGYPGVGGIGPKTASNLLREYGTFENLYKRIGDLPERVGLKLANDAEQAALAKKLATILTDVPIQFVVERCEVGRLSEKEMRSVFEEQGFRSLLKRLDGFFGGNGSSEKNGEDEGVDVKMGVKKKKSDQLELL